jgi:ABC-type nitrate/sulfonate/bicarbonate transport system permease component
MRRVERIAIEGSSKRKSRFSLTGRAIGFLVVLLIFGVWWSAALVVARNSERAQILLPSPANVIASIPRLSVFAGPGAEQSYLMALQVIANNTLASAITLFGGLAIGGFVGVGLGLALGWSPRLRWFFEGPLLVIRLIPVLALLPLFLSWFGGSQAGAIAYVAFAVFSMLFVNTLEAIRNVDPMVQVYARTLGASAIRVYRTVVVPAIVPELVGGLRVILGVAWAILLAAEFLAAQSGIGHILVLAQQYFDTSRMILIALLIMLYSYAADRLAVVAGARVTRWVPRKGK